jgi:hypothetical protein
MKQQLLINKDGIVKFTYYEFGIAKIPSLAKITIYDETGSEKVAQTTADINTTTGEMSYTITASILDTLARNWKASWEFTVNSVVKYEDQLFNIVNQVLSNPVITQDIIERAPFLDEQNYRRVFQADSGTAITIVSNELNEIDNWWTNGDVKIEEGTNKDETRKVISFDSSTQTLTVSIAFSNPIDNTSVVLIVRSFEKEIDEAFNIFINDLRNRGIKSDLIYGSEQINEFVINKTLELVCGNFSKDIADIWFAREEKYKNRYDELFNNLNLDYDENEDGNIDEDEANSSFSQITADR